ncbi:ATR-interacting protein isoform X3 [Myripristis murdjan]|uniref:ATR-interacting protein isoform X3 n=1 Tax=Myripristis murdjan TaxID=586833 RepID=UPI001175D1DA|nr:ATR-interacting protein isoform X3 [Myripristis murdjan]
MWTPTGGKRLETLLFLIMACPPTKRLRGLNQEAVAVFDNSFGDDEDFTQDDLDEIDIIASQADLGGGGGLGPKPTVGGSTWTGEQSRPLPLGRARTNQSRENARGNSREAGGVGQRCRADSLLEAQHAELKRKLQQLEEDVVLKSGEVRVLRDALRAAQQEKEAQRQEQLLLQRDRQREQSDREKELSRKVQSLQSELQFKEAEMNEMKSKVHSSDRSSKTASPLPRNSPRVLSCVAQLNHGSSSSSSSPTGSGFITKETFGAQLQTRMTPVKTPGSAQKDDRGVSGSRSTDKQEVPRPDPFLSIRPKQHQCRGGALLGLLLQQPLSPSSLGLCHLLSVAAADAHGSSSSAAFLLRSDSARLRSAGSSAHSLALTGLNLLSQTPPPAAHAAASRVCPGAVLLLPLLSQQLSRLCQALEALHSAGPAPEEAGRSDLDLQEAGLAALRALNLLLDHSQEVVEALLSEPTEEEQTDPKTEQCAVGAGQTSQHALLRCVLRLCDVTFSSRAARREDLLQGAMTTLCVLLERSTHTHRLQCVLRSSLLCVCVSADSRCQVVSRCVSVLRSVADHRPLARQLCSQHDNCVFLRLFHYIRTRPDSQATHTQWIMLDLQVVRLLNRLLTQRAESWSAFAQSNCQCYTELVQTVVVLLHRQWLELRSFQEPTDAAAGPVRRPLRAGGGGASLLREAVLLLHWLLLQHGSFSLSCRPLLHMYDQAVPSARDTLRSLHPLSESEELALDEICRSEADDADDMDTDTGP